MFSVFCFFVLLHSPDTSAATSDTVRLLFGGDVTLGYRFEQMVGDNIEHAFQYWNHTPKPDLFMVNLENPITTATMKFEKQWNFKMPRKYLSVLQHGGINVVTCANNHIFDYGREGIVETMSALDSAGIMRVGIGKTIAEARTPKIISIKGKKIALLGYAGWSFPATSKRPGVAPRSVDLVVEDVKKVRPTVDFVVVNFHWGEELALEPNKQQRYLAYRTIDAGADAIIGHHPHVLQGIELYKGKPIAYSLGNFIFGGNERNTYETALLSIELNNSSTSVSLLPVAVKNYQPSVAEGEMKKRILDTVQQRSQIFPKTISFK